MSWPSTRLGRFTDRFGVRSTNRPFSRVSPLCGYFGGPPCGCILRSCIRIIIGHCSGPIFSWQALCISLRHCSMGLSDRRHAAICSCRTAIASRVSFEGPAAVADSVAAGASAASAAEAGIYRTSAAVMAGRMLPIENRVIAVPSNANEGFRLLVADDALIGADGHCGNC